MRPIGAFDPTAVGCAQVISVVATGKGAGTAAATPGSFVGAADPRSPCGGTASR